MSRLVVISNRVGPLKDSGRAGGLAIALGEALSAYGGIWYGWSGNVVDNADARLSMESVEGLTLATLDLSDTEYDEYYNGFANRCLWPLFHFRIGLTAYDRRFYDGYLKVNAKFAQGIYPLLTPDDLVWVHDYHFLGLGSELRRMGAEQAIGFFLHIPFPSREVFATLPNHDALVRSMFAYDVVGFQTENDRGRFVDYVVRELGGHSTDHHVTAFGRTIEARAFPIGIDVDRFAEMAMSDDGVRQQDAMLNILGGRAQIIGVDRLDYTKGIPERFLAFERLLEDYPENRGKVAFMQVAPPSRGEVAEYVDIRQELEGLAGRINGRFSEFDWVPIRYLNRAFSRTALAGLFRASKVGLVTPLRDGMNLVAKEYIAAQDPDNPGVLVLSRFAGAAHQMQEALIVNPYDVQGVAEALQTARTMPLEERQERYQSLIAGLREYDINRWRDEFLDTLLRAGGRLGVARTGTAD